MLAEETSRLLLVLGLVKGRLLAKGIGSRLQLRLAKEARSGGTSRLGGGPVTPGLECLFALICHSVFLFVLLILLASHVFIVLHLLALASQQVHQSNHLGVHSFELRHRLNRGHSQGLLDYALIGVSLNLLVLVRSANR